MLMLCHVGARAEQGLRPAYHTSGKIIVNVLHTTPVSPIEH
jgi:hypothetical protein